MNKLLELEGTWEEILRRGKELSGRRVRVTVLDEQSLNSSAQIARQWAVETETLEPNPGRQPTGRDAELHQLLCDKFRKQGLKI